MKFIVVLDPAEEGGFNVSVPALDGCFTQGESEEDAMKNAKEAILCYLEGMEKVNEIKTKPGIIAKEVELAYKTLSAIPPKIIRYPYIIVNDVECQRTGKLGLANNRLAGLIMLKDNILRIGRWFDEEVWS